MVRVLALHGYAQSAEIFKKKVSLPSWTLYIVPLTSGHLDECNQEIMWQEHRFWFVLSYASPIVLTIFASLVFLDAPILLKPADMPQSAGTAQALDTIQAPPDEPELQPRAWWKANSDKTVYYHVPETMEYMRNYLKNEKFDVSATLNRS